MICSVIFFKIYSHNIKYEYFCSKIILNWNIKSCITYIFGRIINNVNNKLRSDGCDVSNILAWLGTSIEEVIV